PVPYSPELDCHLLCSPEDMDHRAGVNAADVLGYRIIQVLYFVLSGRIRELYIGLRYLVDAGRANRVAPRLQTTEGVDGHVAIQVEPPLLGVHRRPPLLGDSHRLEAERSHDREGVVCLDEPNLAGREPRLLQRSPEG